jgi:hypothetical protein
LLRLSARGNCYELPGLQGQVESSIAGLYRLRGRREDPERSKDRCPLRGRYSREHFLDRLTPTVKDRIDQRSARSGKAEKRKPAVLSRFGSHHEPASFQSRTDPCRIRGVDVKLHGNRAGRLRAVPGDQNENPQLRTRDPVLHLDHRARCYSQERVRGEKCLVKEFRRTRF